MKKLHFMIIFIFIFLSLYTPAAAAQSIDIPGDIAYILIDSKTGRVLAEQNADQQLGPASLTKIMTAIVALENGDPGQMMEVSQQAVYDIGKGGMNVGIMAGEKGLTLENMLNILLIKSANESANIIAENVASSRSEFMELVNRRAVELGAVNTTFVNPCGKDTEKEDAGHLTTPRDIAVMARHAMTIPEFRKIVATEYYKGMPATDKHDDWGILRNTNQFLWYDNTYPYSLDGVEYKYTVNGIKTGYTFKAGNNLVTSAVGEDGMELISVVMHVTQPNKIYGYAKNLLRYGFENFSLKTISEAGQLITTVPVLDAAGGDAILSLVTETGLSTVLPIEMREKNIQSKVNIVQPVKAPVQKGDVLGDIEYSINGTSLGNVKIISTRSIQAAVVPGTESSATKDSQDNTYSYVVLGILTISSGFVVLRIVLRRISRKMKRKKYEKRFLD